MNKLILYFAILLFCSNPILAQVSINTDESLADPSAGLDIKFTDRGLLIPRLNFEQRKAVVSPAQGLMIFCTDCGVEGSLSIFSNGSWKTFSRLVLAV